MELEGDMNVDTEKCYTAVKKQWIEWMYLTVAWKEQRVVNIKKGSTKEFE